MHLDVWEYQDDKLQRITTYMDLQSLMVVTGLMPAPQLPVLQPVTPMADPAPTGLSPVAAVDEGLSRWNAHNLAEFAKILRGDAQVLFALLGAPLDRPSAIAMMELFYQGFGDLKFDVARHLDLGEGWVLTEGVYRGTNSGPYLGLPATGRAVEVRAALLNQVDNQGLICAERVYFDNISALTQLGYFPPSPRLSFQRTAKGMIITYEGSLLSAPSVTAPWHLVGGASSPHTVTATNGPMFFKAQQ